MAAEIYPAARERLLQIWDYTERKWGEEQADAYVRGLVAAAHDLRRQRIHWRPVRGDRFPGIWFIRHEHHYLFFRVLSDGDIGIISILHENMDLPARLKEDAERGSDT
jgi:plasmid stabilization system protein ParE